MAKLKVHGFDSFKKSLDEAIYNPGFITEYEEGSIDDLTPATDDAAPAEPVADDAAPADDAPVEQTTAADDAPAAEAPAEEAPAPDAGNQEADLDFGASDDADASQTKEYQTKIGFVAGVFDEYKKYLNEEGKLKDVMKKKIDAAFNLLNSEE